jgi:hypothetical protein
MAVIFQTFSFADAQYRVHITKIPNSADLWVYPISYLGGHRGDLVWYLTANQDEATCSIYLCDYGQADVRVYFVKRFADACWRNKVSQGRFRFR